MKEKGFTLVELLAVIAILAILVIIALPNVLKMFNDSKKNSFLTEAKTVYSEVSKKYITESMKGNKLTYISSEDDTKLNMTGKELQYCVLLNDDGSVSEMKVSNGTWIATLPKGKEITDLSSKDLTDGNLDDYKCSNGNSGGSKPFDQEDSWKVIASNAKKCVDNPDSCAYKVGDTKTIEMGTLGTHTLRIANLKSPTEEGCGTEGFSQSACGFVIEFADIITTHDMNTSSTNAGGWPASQIKTFIDNDIYNSLPNELKNIIINTKTVSGYGADCNCTGDFVSEDDKLYLLSTHEVWENGTSNPIADTAWNKTRQLDYYKNKGVIITTSSSSTKGAIKYYNGSKAVWWLRSAISFIDIDFYTVNDEGGEGSSSAGSTYGVSPAFRIG